MNIPMIAHDMRTPLNAILLGTQAAKMMVGNHEELKQALSLIEKNTRTVAEMVESLLAVSAQELTQNATLNFQDCLPSELITQAVEQVASSAASKSISIKQAPTDQIVRADKNRLLRVLVNLLSNAIKFTPEGGQIEVEARFRNNDSHSVIVFSVRDDGVGISEEDINRIFMEGVSISRTIKSSNGLGLAVCKELIEAHGGRIWVETGRSKGAAFSFSIPLEQQTAC